ncbi:MAG: hypothetical protein M3Y64_08420 [Gemmatimonadota bacterium]|nr:hypothetical protein [Gemmatimonadota bacterium]
MNLSRWLSRLVASTLMAVTVPVSAHAQTVVIVSPRESLLQTATPTVTIRALGISSLQRPLRFTLYVTRNSTGDSPYTDTVTVSANDTTASILVSKLLPNNGIVYLKARVTQPGGTVTESEILGPYQAPRWLKLLFPNPISGDGVTTRRPKFIWQSAKVDPIFGAWKYDLQILNSGLTEQSASGIADTTFTPNDELQANRPYTWQVHAVLPHGEEATERSAAKFLISDPSLPTTTLLYQNFPNPFPSHISFSTCFWFDIGAGGARVTLDVLDLRGNLVRSIVPATTFAPGTFGRGTSGGGSNCDNRYVWDGTATDGRTVARGVYLLRFIANGATPAFKKIVFLGR